MKPRLSTEACDHAEGNFDYWEGIWADGEVSPHEADGMGLRLAEHVTIASLVDEAVAEGVATIRRSGRSPHVIRLRNERRLRDERAA